ncbi:MoxR family ATPase [Aetokthonos hydrillicola Thurmond2011]|jgi:MoxR-like ATPase|uniref:MoxR family ATPase n=1 Tax=Aetokthonos hydrillicola Thurmond2011 TaxID=2712845 RepID=A0AAP5MAK8_9CYAN|nr:MoxR family ATPase [Aetokthonos hydrillicola]MBO3461800.1 MoxR family ATPase [Aetokthonos hydrillicola CCALA 1050]MBW4589944.1 MoxR family ATPase [Aetokthonos hydrillicola CCALA 1050]MDR9895729.1 MoxR family ATPase [Aetokthonos hydrillicola Thurmond2011]
MDNVNTQKTGLSGTEIYQKICDNIQKVMKGQSSAIRKLLSAFASGGHVLLEDYPGTGKTTLAKALAYSVDVMFKRIQFTPDLLPSDILGVSVLDPNARTFHFHEGAIFTHILLADEINRASPRTQSALLEAMAEFQVSVDGNLKALKDPFFVIATQNPVELRGTYPLPEAQMDRFALQFSLGYISPEDEVNLLKDQIQRHPIDTIQPCVNLEDVITLKQQVKQIRISQELKEYLVKIVNATRSAEGVKLGASPRASIALMKVAQALALFDGYQFVTPEHIQELAVSVIAHRLVMENQARFSGRTAQAVVEEILQSVPVPV